MGYMEYFLLHRVMEPHLPSVCRVGPQICVSLHDLVNTVNFYDHIDSFS